MTAEERYLPLFDEEGGWALERPDLYVLVRLSVREDLGDEEGNEQAYRYMASASDNTKPVLNGPQALLERQYISGHMTERRYAAMVLTELLRLRSSGEKPTLGKALKLVVPELRNEKRNTEPSSLEHRAKRAFKRWRNTCHLELAFRIATSRNGKSFEADQEQFKKFLAMARALEVLMDDVCEQSELTWKPWRVPVQIAPDLCWEIAPLSVEERNLVTAPRSNAAPRKRQN